MERVDRVTLKFVIEEERKGDAFHIETYNCGRDYVQTQNIRVPIWQVQLHVSYTFGKQGMKTKDHKSRIQNDFMEKKSEQEQVTPASGTM